MFSAGRFIMGWLFSILLLNALVISAQQDYPIRFSNVAHPMGLSDQILGVAVHGAAWGDINGDHYPDLFLGVFANHSIQPNLIQLNKKGKVFRKMDNPEVEIRSRNSGASFADFDGDGMLDLLMQDDAVWHLSIGHSRLMRNTGDLVFEDVTLEAGLVTIPVSRPVFNDKPVSCPPGLLLQSASCRDTIRPGVSCFAR